MQALSSFTTNDGKVPVQLMDFGDVELVSHEKLRALNSTTLAQLPPQAIRVVLSRVPPSPEAARKLRRMVPCDSRCVDCYFSKLDYHLKSSVLFFSV